LLGVYVVAGVCVEDELGIHPLCQHFLTCDVGFEDDGPEVHWNAGWQVTLVGHRLQIVGLIRGKDDNRHAAQLRGSSH
jgi:hypothetical protein